MTNDYVIIGCGGIGYHLAEPLARMLMPMPRSRLFLVDGKPVRRKNLLRQFGTDDIGRSKAECLAGHVRRVLREDDPNVSIVPVDAFVEPELLAHHEEWLSSQNPTIFVCVDNKPSRVYVEDLVEDRFRSCTVISGGNEEIDGQAVLFRRKNGRTVDPLPSEIDPDLAEHDNQMPSSLPCDEATESEPQLALANMGAALAMLGLWYGQVLNTPDRADRRFNYARFNVSTPEIFPSTESAMAEA